MNKPNCCDTCKKLIHTETAHGSPMKRMVCSDSACSCHSLKTTHCNNCADPFAEEQNETEDSAACAYCDCHKTTDSEDWEGIFSDKFGGITADDAGEYWLPLYEDIKDFIRETRTAAYESGIRQRIRNSKRRKTL